MKNSTVDCARPECNEEVLLGCEAFRREKPSISVDKGAFAPLSNRKKNEL